MVTSYQRCIVITFIIDLIINLVNLCDWKNSKEPKRRKKDKFFYTPSTYFGDGQPFNQLSGSY